MHRRVTLSIQVRQPERMLVFSQILALLQSLDGHFQLFGAAVGSSQVLGYFRPTMSFGVRGGQQYPDRGLSRSPADLLCLPHSAPSRRYPPRPLPSTHSIDGLDSSGRLASNHLFFASVVDLGFHHCSHNPSRTLVDLSLSGRIASPVSESCATNFCH